MKIIGGGIVVDGSMAELFQGAYQLFGEQYRSRIRFRGEIYVAPLIDTMGEAFGVLGHQLTEEQLASVVSIHRDTNKIAAIKRVRELTGAGLTEAKHFVEHPNFVRLCDG